MQRILREQARKFAFDWRDEPLLRGELARFPEAQEKQHRAQKAEQR